MKVDSRTVTLQVTITGPTLKVLSVMSKEIGQGATAISNRAWVGYDTARGILVALQDIGLVVKLGRHYAWFITDKGRAVLDQLKAQEAKT